LDAAEIPLQLIPFNPESAQPPSLLEPDLLPEPPCLLIAPVNSGLFELPVTALSEYACCPKRFLFRFVEGHPGMDRGIMTAQRIGSLVHLALKREIRDVDTLASFDVGLERQFVVEAIALAQRFEQVPVFTPFRQAINSREQPVTLALGRLTFNGVVDLVGQDWVLDFKTNQEISPQHHQFQLWAYAAATKRQTAHIAYLRHDHLQTFSASDLEATSQEAQMLVKGIWDGHYPAMPSHSNCRWCAYAEICSDRHQQTLDGEQGGCVAKTC
jgi:ATP-dependent helicase/nuclease subunit A